MGQSDARTTSTTAALPELTDRRYVLLEKLGEGGMGIVYKAYDRLMGQMVALKWVRVAADQIVYTTQIVSSPSSTSTFLSLAHEFRVLASIRHPNIINEYTYGFDKARRPYLTMEYLEGAQPITRYAFGRSTQEKIDLALQMLHALAYLHRRGIIHRDLKPANVLIWQGQARVLDFGIALAQGDPESPAGTVAYMSPEQLEGLPASEASDLYAVGVMLYEMFAGGHPFPTEPLAVLLNGILFTDPDLDRLRIDPIQVQPTAETPTADSPPPTSPPETRDDPTTYGDYKEINSPHTTDTARGLPDDERTITADGNAVPFPLPQAPRPSPTPTPRRDETEGSGLRMIIGRLLQKSPADRYHSAETLIRDLCLVAGFPLPSEGDELREGFLQPAHFAGRDEPLLVMQNALKTLIRTGQGGMWLIGGESGGGKSRFLDEIVVNAHVAGVHVLRATYSGIGETPYHLWGSILHQILLRLDVSDHEAGVVKPLIPNIEQLLDRPVADLPPLEGKANYERFVTTFLGLFRRIKNPKVVIFEDVHQRKNLDALNRLAALTTLVPLVIIGSYRDDERPALPHALPAAEVITLGRFTSDAVGEIVESMIGKTPPAVVKALYQETEGNAFALVESVRALAEDSGGLLNIGGTRRPEDVPTGGLGRLIRRRLGRVSAADYARLEYAALIGRDLDLAVLKSLGGSVDLLDDWLTRCAIAAILDSPNNIWRFSHDYLRAGILAALDDARRPPLHAEIAESMGRVYGEQPMHAATIAHHYTEAGDPVRAASYGAVARAYAALWGEENT